MNKWVSNIVETVLA